VSQSPAAKKRRQTLMVAGAASVVALAAVMFLMRTATDPPVDSGPAPAETVAKLDQFAGAAEWDKVDTLVDYETKGRNMVTDLWDASDQNGRDAMVRLLKQLFYASWTRYHTSGEFKGGFETRETMTGADTATVEQVADGPDGREFAMMYYLSKRSNGWVIVERVHRRGDITNTTELFVKSLRKNIASEIGHPPTLAEFAANAPSWVGRIRSRMIKVP
jgi:hypothetical protein